MELVEILFSQALRLLTTTSPTLGTLYGGALFQAFESRYGFLQAPRTVPEFDLSKGVTFLHGFHERKYVIDKFQIFNDGIICDTKASSDVADSFIDDAIAWAQQEAGLIPGPVNGRGYFSRLVVKCDLALDQQLNQFSNLGAKIAEKIRSYGQQTGTWGASGISLHGDMSQQAVKLKSFSLERREWLGYDSNTYYSSAPLRTADHIEFINDFINIFKS